MPSGKAGRTLAHQPATGEEITITETKLVELVAIQSLDNFDNETSEIIDIHIPLKQ